MDNKEEININEYNEILNNFKLKSPIHKIQIDLDNKNSIAGAYLLIKKDIDDYFSNIINKSDINPNTILVFETRHVMECCQIISGPLLIFKERNIISEDYIIHDFINRVIRSLLTTPKFYDDVIMDMKNILKNHGFDNYNENNNSHRALFEVFTSIFMNIWFITYSDIDNIVQEAINKLEKEVNENE